MNPVRTTMTSTLSYLDLIIMTLNRPDVHKFSGQCVISSGQTFILKFFISSPWQHNANNRSHDSNHYHSNRQYNDEVDVVWRVLSIHFTTSTEWSASKRDDNFFNMRCCFCVCYVPLMNYQAQYSIFRLFERLVSNSLFKSDCRLQPVFVNFSLEYNACLPHISRAWTYHGDIGILSHSSLNIFQLRTVKQTAVWL